MSKPTGRPNGRPRSLRPEQERQVYDRINTTRRGKRCFALAEMAHELGVGVSTLERILTQQRRERLAEIVTKFHEQPQNPTPGVTP